MMEVISYHIKKRGFTLIELLVVLTLMMLVVTLVAPMGVDMVDKAQSQTEYVKLQTMLKKISNKAFLSTNDIKVEFKDNVMTVSLGLDDISEIYFTNLLFSKGTKEVVFNRNGFPSVQQVKVIVHNKETILNLLELYEK